MPRFSAQDMLNRFSIVTAYLKKHPKATNESINKHLKKETGYGMSDDHLLAARKAFEDDQLLASVKGKVDDLLKPLAKQIDPEEDLVARRLKNTINTLKEYMKTKHLTYMAIHLNPLTEQIEVKVERQLTEMLTLDLNEPNL